MEHSTRASVTMGLRQAIPYLRVYQEGVFVVKAGGAVFQDPEATDRLLEQIGILHQVGIHVVLVHGGGPQTTELSSRLGIETTLIDGRRVTDAETIRTSAMVLNGEVRTAIVARLRKHGVNALGLCGVDAGLAVATKRPPVYADDGHRVDYGFVGDLVEMDPSLLHAMFKERIVPVVSPLCADAQGEVLNVNADTFAARLAATLDAQKFILVSDVPGLLERKDDPSSLISYVDLAELERMTESGAIAGGMRPKITAIRAALAAGVPRAHLIGHAAPDGLLAEVFTNEGCGTLIVPTKRDLAPSEALLPEPAGLA